MAKSESPMLLQGTLDLLILHASSAKCWWTPKMNRLGYFTST